LQNEAEFAGIGDDTVVNDGKFVAVATNMSDTFDRMNNNQHAAEFFL
jgi:hypothetical protein